MTAWGRASGKQGAVALCAALVAAAVLLSPAPAAVAATGYAPGDCPIEIPAVHAHRVSCGVLTVPEARGGVGDPARELRLPVIRIESTAAEPAADPVVFPTSGGPGGGSISSLRYFLDHADWITDERDVILVEQRGDVDAQPTLDCPELDTSRMAADGVLPVGTAIQDRYAAGLTQCRERLVAAGVNLSAYTSAASVADLADLRAALGYGEWNLYGVSYGTRLAMTVMRDRPDGLRAVVLDGVYPPNINRFELTPQGFRHSIDWLLEACAADADCDRRYPDLGDSLAAVLERTSKEPIAADVRNPSTGAPLRVEVDDAAVMRGLFSAFYDAGAVRVLPFVIDRLAHGDDGVILPLAQQQIDFQDVLAEGLSLSVECAEEVPFNNPALIEESLQADAVLSHYAGLSWVAADCAIWNVPALPATENGPVSSSVPTLITSGQFDPVTPSAWSEPAAAGLTAAYRYEFPSLGHGAVWSNWYEPCAASVASRFLRDPSTEPDTSCIAEAAPIDFVTTADIHPTAAVYRLNADVLQGRSLWQPAMALTMIIGLAGILVYALGYGVHRMVRRSGDAPDGAVLAAGVAAGADLAFVAALAYVLLRTDPLILGFGLPAAAWPIALLPLVGVVLTLLLCGLLIFAGVRREASSGHVVVLWIAAGVLLLFAAWMLSRGLIAL